MAADENNRSLKKRNAFYCHTSVIRHHFCNKIAPENKIFEQNRTTEHHFRPKIAPQMWSPPTPIQWRRAKYFCSKCGRPLPPYNGEEPGTLRRPRVPSATQRCVAASRPAPRMQAPTSRGLGCMLVARSYTPENALPNFADAYFPTPSLRSL